MSEDDLKKDKHFMRRALALAMRYYGRTGENPVVGALVVKDGRIVGKGAHREAGKEHAEVLALRDAGELSIGSTLYVTLEPCNHFGKTGPCTQEILRAGVSRVVFGLSDPNIIASGGGDFLRAQGVEVCEGVYQEEIRQVLSAWIFELNNKRKSIDLLAYVNLDGSLLRQLPKYSKTYGLESLHSEKGIELFLNAKFDRLIVVRINSSSESEAWPKLKLKLKLEKYRILESRTISIYRCFQE